MNILQVTSHPPFLSPVKPWVDTTHPLAVIGARRFRITKQKFRPAKRIHRSAYPASFEAKYTPVSDGFYSSASSMEHWLTERYCLYTYDDRYVYRGDIHHTPWTLHHAKAFISENSMLTPLRFPVKQSQPLLHYARKKKVRIFPFVRVASI